MKQQFVGLVFSVLLFSTFGRELLTRHKQHQSTRIAHSQARSSLLPHTRKNSEVKKCATVCYIPGRQPRSNLTVSYNPSSRLVSIVNETIQVGLVVDYSESLAAIYYQPKETLILIDWEGNTGVVISGRATKEVGWHTEVPLQHFFQKITSLSVYWSLGQRGSGNFEISTVKTEIAVLIQRALVVLSSGDYRVPEREAAGVLLTLSASWATAVRETWGLVEGGSVTSETTLKLVIGAYQGLALIVSRLKDGCSAVIEKHIAVCLNTLINVSSSFELTANLVVTFVAKGINVEEIIGDVIKNRVTVLEIVIAAGGNSSEGLTGLVRVVRELVLVAHNQDSLERVIDILIDFYTNNPNLNYKQFVEQIVAGIKTMLEIFKRAHVERQLKIWIKDLKALLKHKSEKNDVVLSVIFNSMLATDDSTPLQRIVRATIILQKKAAPETIGYLFFKLFEYLVENQIDVIINLYPKVKINGNEKNVVHILRYLNTTELSSRDNCVQALSKAPLISDIAQGVNKTLTESTNGSITLNLLVRSESFFKYIKSIIQIIVSINRGEKPTEPLSSNKTDSSRDNGTSTSVHTDDGKDKPSGSSSHETGSSSGKGKGGDGGNVEISGVGNSNSNNASLQVNNSGGKGGQINSEGGHEVHKHTDYGSGTTFEIFKGGNSSADVDGGNGGNTKISNTGNDNKNSNIQTNSSGGEAGKGSSKGGEARSKDKGRRHAKGHEKHKEKH